jgi:hypothetical protein
MQQLVALPENGDFTCLISQKMLFYSIGIPRIDLRGGNQMAKDKGNDKGKDKDKKDSKKKDNKKKGK